MDNEKFALRIRLETSKMLLHLGFGHLGGSFSIIETLAVLYNEKMKIDPRYPDWEERDWFVLSKGHSGPSLYATLALKNYFPVSELQTLNQNGTHLPSHPDRMKTTGIDVTTGSLGQGISEATGVAYGLKLQEKDNHVYCIVGDGECNEGQVWEALQFISHHQLSNLILFVDNNKEQVDGRTERISFHFHFKPIMEAFDFYTQEVDGSSCQAISQAIDQALKSQRPSVILLDTIKGQGINYFEKLESSHHIKITGENKKAIERAIAEMTARLEKC